MQRNTPMSIGMHKQYPVIQRLRHISYDVDVAAPVTAWEKHLFS